MDDLDIVIDDCQKVIPEDIEKIRFYSSFKSGGNFPYLINCRPPKDVLEELDARANSPKYTAMTITFKPHFQLMEEKEARHAIVSLLANTPEIKHYTLFPDIDVKGNFHYHGVVEIQTKHKPMVKRRFTQHIGFIKFDYISDPSGWVAYCRKDKGFRSKEHGINKDGDVKGQGVPLDEPIYTDNELCQLLISDCGRFI